MLSLVVSFGQPGLKEWRFCQPYFKEDTPLSLVVLSDEHKNINVYRNRERENHLVKKLKKQNKNKRTKNKENMYVFFTLYIISKICIY